MHIYELGLHLQLIFYNDHRSFYYVDHQVSEKQHLHM
jgi:hypothetical protein